ncbi:MAG: hypothetical protein J6T80_00795 [Paludibacteraceae bacterium]|nr:hypothetical protein [Paludibacteraceae bacterium]
MRKYLFIGLLAVMGTLMTGCKYEVYDCEKHEHLHKQTIDLIVPAADWKFDNTAQQYYVRFNVPELTSEVLAFGNVNVHRIYNVGTDNEFQTALPETLFLWQDVTENGTTTQVYYQQLIDYMAGIGYVELTLTMSDFYYTGFAPGDMRFHLQLIY